jgi:hypothetical protein
MELTLTAVAVFEEINTKEFVVTVDAVTVNVVTASVAPSTKLNAPARDRPMSAVAVTAALFSAVIFKAVAGKIIFVPCPPNVTAVLSVVKSYDGRFLSYTANVPDVGSMKPFNILTGS